MVHEKGINMLSRTVQHHPLCQHASNYLKIPTCSAPNKSMYRTQTRGKEKIQAVQCGISIAATTTTAITLMTVVLVSSPAIHKHDVRYRNRQFVDPNESSNPNTCKTYHTWNKTPKY